MPHTPGPWEISCETKVSADIVNHELELAIATVHGDDDEANANARLIVTAPKLLEACDQLSSVVDAWQSEQEDGEPHVAAMRAALMQALTAIAKATGKQT